MKEFEVDVTFLANHKEKAIKRRKTAKDYEQEGDSSCIEDIIDTELKPMV